MGESGGMQFSNSVTFSAANRLQADGDVSYSDPLAWASGSVPGAEETAVIMPRDPTTVTLNSPIEVENMLLSGELFPVAGETRDQVTVACGPLCVVVAGGLILGPAVSILWSESSRVNAGETIVEPGVYWENNGTHTGDVRYKDGVPVQVDPSFYFGDDSFIDGSFINDGNTTSGAQGAFVVDLGSDFSASGIALGVEAGGSNPAVIFSPGNEATPISNMTVTQRFVASRTTRLDLQLSGVGADTVHVGEQAVLNGDIHVTTLDFQPTVGDFYDLVLSPDIRLFEESGGLVLPPTLEGSLDVVDLLDGTQAARFTVTEVLALPDGDFNEDGRVDAADYTVWRDGLGSTYSNADYEDWRTNFGATATPIGSTAIPEPTAAVLASLLLLSAARRRRV